MNDINYIEYYENILLINLKLKGYKTGLLISDKEKNVIKKLKKIKLKNKNKSTYYNLNNSESDLTSIKSNDKEYKRKNQIENKKKYFNNNNTLNVVINRKSKFKSLKSFVNIIKKDYIITKLLKKLFNFKSLKKNNYVINPNNLYNKIFSAYINLIIVYSVTIIPFYMAFIIDNSKIFYIFIIEIIIDISMIIDLILNFFIGFYEDNILILDQKRIFFNYLFTWFALDFISSFPFRFILNNNKSYIVKFSRIPKLIRLLKLTKLLRVLKVIKNKKYLQKFFSKMTKPGFDRLLSSFFLLIIIIHSLGCIWFVFGNFDNKESWIVVNKIKNENIITQYIYSLYWAVQTIFTVGYGDLGAQNSYEYIFSIITQFLGILMNSIIIGTISSLNNNINSIKKEKDKLFDNFFKLKRRNTNLKNIFYRVEKYLNNKYIDDKSLILLLNTIPEKLKNDLNSQIINNKITNLNYFKNKSVHFISYLIPFLKEKKYLTNETLYKKNDKAENVYFIYKGKVVIYYEQNNEIYQISKFEEGDYFGEIDIFYYSNKRMFKAICLVDTVVFELNRKLFEDIYLRKFPDCGENMLFETKSRKYQIDFIFKKYKIRINKDLTHSSFNSIEYLDSLNNLNNICIYEKKEDTLNNDIYKNIIKSCNKLIDMSKIVKKKCNKKIIKNNLLNVNNKKSNRRSMKVKLKDDLENFELFINFNKSK